MKPKLEPPGVHAKKRKKTTMSIPELHQITKVHGLLHAKLCIELAEIQLGRAATADLWEGVALEG